MVQQAYRGWNQLAYVLAVQFLAMVALAVLSRHQSTVFWPVVIAILGLLGAQAVFWIYTYPANVETNDWTFIPEHWRSLRSQWEYSHAAGAALQLLAMSSLGRRGIGTSAPVGRAEHGTMHQRAETR